jgi:hypothetical protein
VAAGYPQRHERYAELGKAALKMMEQNMSAELTTAADRLGSARTLE